MDSRIAAAITFARDQGIARVDGVLAGLDAELPLVRPPLSPPQKTSTSTAPIAKKAAPIELPETAPPIRTIGYRGIKRPTCWIN